jgi:hypothetical protein
MICKVELRKLVLGWRAAGELPAAYCLSIEAGIKRLVFMGRPTSLHSA